MKVTTSKSKMLSHSIFLKVSSTTEAKLETQKYYENRVWSKACVLTKSWQNYSSLLNLFFSIDYLQISWESIRTQIYI